MPIPTESIGSIPRSRELLTAMQDHAAGPFSDAQLQAAQSEALGDTIAGLEKTGSPVLTDGEQTKPSFATYPLAGLRNLAPDGVTIPFADGHTRQLPLAPGPFAYGVHAVAYLKAAQKYTTRPLKQAVISASRHLASFIQQQDCLITRSRNFWRTCSTKPSVTFGSASAPGQPTCRSTSLRRGSR